MTLTVDQLRGVLLDLIAPRRVPDHAVLAGLQEEEWTALVTMGHQHRVLPLAHARLGAEGADWPVPERVRTACADSFRGYSFHAIRSQRVIALAVRALAARGIEAIPLKGAWLAFNAYPQPGLRPMRDIDLLVPEAQALEAFAVLRETGLDLLDPESGDPAAALAVKHQLPALWSAQDEICIELHHRCFHGRGNEPDLTDDPHFRDRMVTGRIADTAVRYMGPEHLLLHLIVHTAHDHLFDNGPGIFADVEALLATHSLDWAEFWRLAARYRAGTAATFVLVAAERLWGAEGIDWSGREDKADEVSNDLVADLASLSLRDPAASRNLLIGVQLDRRTGLWAKARFAVEKLFPHPAVLRATYAGTGTRADLPQLYLRRLREKFANRLSVATAGQANVEDRPRLAALAKRLEQDKSSH